MATRLRNRPAPEIEELLLRQPVALVDARRLTQHFARMVGNREGEKLDGWLEEAETPEAQVMTKGTTSS